MFCPSCGTEYTIGLPYCNRCGANLNSALTQPAEVGSVDLTRAIATIGTTLAVLTLGGFLALIVGASKLAEKPAMSNDTIIALIVMGMLTILTSDIFLVRQLSKLINASLSSGITKKRMNASAPMQQLPRPNTAPIFQSPSVTENTTRFLEEAYRAPSEAQPSEKRNV